MRTAPPLLPPLLLSLLSLCLPACLENEEVLEIHPDGSVDVTLAARGHVLDLADGYPLPFGAGWRPVGADTERWARDLGPRTGGPGLRERAKAIAWPAEAGEAPRARLEVRGRFASVEDLQRTYATPDEPYASAYLTRDTRLSVARRGRATVYVFERTYRGFERERFHPLGQDSFPETIEQEFDQRMPLLPAERDEVALTVGMPGTIVGGNFDRVEDGRAHWKLQGGRLGGQDLVLRAVSVLE